MCSNRLFDAKFKNVFTIRDGLLIMKLSIIPLFASTSHNTINPITILNCTTLIKIFSFFFFFKYCFLSCDIFFSFLFMYIKSFPNDIKIFTEFRTFSAIKWCSIFHFKIYFMYFFYNSWSIS